MTGPEAGGFVHIEFASTDPARTRTFLGDVFGWEFQSIPGMDYQVYATPLGPGGAVMGLTEERPPGVLDYILSTDIEADIKRIEAAGGRILGAKQEIPGVGWWGLFEEPTGIVLALFQSQSPDRGPVGRYRTDTRGRTRPGAQGKTRPGRRGTG